jgi:hypothetical protein
MGVLDKLRKSFEVEDTWPPREVRQHWSEIESYRRRYRNSRQEMIEANPNIATNNSRVEIYMPVPWPREICRFSSALLFSSTPQITSATDREKLAQIEQVNDIGAFAVRGGVKVACEGRVGIRIIIDPDIDAKTPLLALVPDDNILWDIRHGSFYAGGTVIITRKINPGDKITYRLFEEHTVGMVKRFLYKGDDRELGRQVPLTTFPEFANLPPETMTGLDKPTLIPWENVPGGESDLFGMGALFDGLNESESLLLGRARKSQPQTFVDRSLLDETGKLDLEGYHIVGGTRMRMTLGSNPMESIVTVDPKVELVQHIQYQDHLTQLVVTCAGYAPLTWGIEGKTASVQRAVSGYAMKMAQLRTLLNRTQKEHMALEAMGWALAIALAMYDGTSEVASRLPSIQLGDGLPDDELDGAQQVQFLRQAVAASTETLVKIVHPSWSQLEIDEEVQRIEVEGFVGKGAGMAGTPLPPNLQAILDGSVDGRVDEDETGDGIDAGGPGISG